MRSFCLHPLAAACMALMAGAAAQAQQQPDAPVTQAGAPQPPKARKAAQDELAQTLAPVTVTATRVEQSITDVPASVSVITAQDMAKQRPRNISDVLRNVEGVDVRVGSTLSAAEAVLMRGIPHAYSGATTAVLLDGMPIRSPIAQVGLGPKSINVFDLEQVDVVRGPASALYGSTALGGVINYVTKRWRGAPGVEIELGGGSHNSRQFAAAAGAAWDAADFRLSAIDYRTDGFIAKTQRDEWGWDLAPRGGKRQNLTFVGNLRPTDNQEISLTLRHADMDADDLGGHPNAHTHPRVRGLDLGYRVEAGDWGVFKARYRNWEQAILLYFDGQTNDGSPTLKLDLDEVDDRMDRSQSFDVQADLRLFAHNTLTFGAAHTRGRASRDWHNIPSNTFGQTVSRVQATSVFIQDEHRFTPQLSVLAGGSWDRYKFYGSMRDGVRTAVPDTTSSVFNPRIALNYKLGEASTLYASAASTYLPVPAAPKIGAPPRRLPNPDIQPETAQSYEIGIRHNTDVLALRAALYHTRFTNLIDSMRLSDATWPQRYVNIGRVDITGLELGAQARLPGGWQPYANYSYAHSIVKKNPNDPLTEGKRKANMSPHHFNLGLTYAPTDIWYASVAGRYVSAKYFNDRNTADSRNPGYFIADLKLGWQLPDWGAVKKPQLTLAVNNLFNKRYTEWWEGEYADRRNFWLGLSMRF